jgi:hypothetical protein
MNVMNKILAIAMSLIFLIFVFELVRRNKLKEKYALLWLVTGFGILLLASWNTLLVRLTNLLGIVMPINTVFFFGIFFVILINLHFSVVISHLTDQNKRLAQKIALLESGAFGGHKER